MKVICYIDGFNLYHSLRQKCWKRYYWLDLWKLTSRFLRKNQMLEEVVYCTTKVKRDAAALQRQMTFINALIATRRKLKLVYGHYLAKDVHCFRCGFVYTRHEEKMTDVNIACHMLTDAMDGRFDVAFLISGDSDLVPPVRIIRDRWPEKRVIVLCPPKRKSEALCQVAHGYKWLAEADFRQSQLSNPVMGDQGEMLVRPVGWS